MRKGVTVFGAIGAVFALGALSPLVSIANDADEPEQRAVQAGEDRWVPSLAITGGITIQDQQGSADSFLDDMNSTPLRGLVQGDDNAVSPFVGGSLELMAPALPIPTRPRPFVSGEILPTFASNRDLAVEGNPSCVRGPEPNAPCAKSPGGLSGASFTSDTANGQGTSLIAQVDTLVIGANFGVAFPFEVRDRQLRIKPSFGWINYEVDADALVVDAACGNPNSVPPSLRCNDFLRETVLAASESQRFNGIGPGLDIEMDAAKIGPIGVSLFLGGRAYAIVGDRTMSFSTSKSFDDQLGMGVAIGQFEVEVDPWMYRAHVGIRFQFLGNSD